MRFVGERYDSLFLAGGSVDAVIMLEERGACCWMKAGNFIPMQVRCFGVVVGTWQQDRKGKPRFQTTRAAFVQLCS